MQTGPIRIGTRGSRLALWQAETVRSRLAAAEDLPADNYEIVVIRTSGDRIQDRALLEAGGKGLFTKEIEEALLDGSIDVAVHSAKDMPTVLPDGLILAAYLEREDVRDALVAAGAKAIDDLRQGAVIGTASLRREALLRRARPDLKVELLRGNVPTRLRKVEAGEFDATLLACAGLKRLGLEEHIAARLPVETFPPACGQGAVVIECREDDERTRRRLARIDHRATALAVACERAFLGVLDGSCRTPIAGYAQVDGDRLEFRGVILSTDGREFYEIDRSGPAAASAEIGEEAGFALRGRAPKPFLAALGIA
ncbi:hydroxymethylbilane synthase [Faunimonas sp. B44]|uniref:hydroxymethylbilane synthase n=1 Tax=Faunimonas sp. B44 TaxID=3461493 RepID=UPI004043A8B5